MSSPKRVLWETPLPSPPFIETPKKRKTWKSPYRVISIVVVEQKCNDQDLGSAVMISKLLQAAHRILAKNF
jgi:hypothetical protein